MLVTMDLERSWYDLVAALDDWTVRDSEGRVRSRFTDSPNEPTEA
jgi:hypothetical protein